MINHDMINNIICSAKSSYDSTVVRIKAIFIDNGFPVKLIEEIKKSVEERIAAGQIEKEKPETQIIHWTIPFIEDSSSDLRKRIRYLNKSLKGAEIKPIFKTSNLGSYFQNKDAIASGLKSNVIYEYSCDRCQMRYIGATKRHPNTRVNEHLKGYPVQTEISMHDHFPKSENFRIIGQYKCPFILETILLKADSYALSNERNGSHELLLNL